MELLSQALASVLGIFNKSSYIETPSTMETPLDLIKPKGFMSIPRELRDQIYSYLLVSTFRVNTSPSMRYCQPLEPNGAYHEPDPIYESTEAPLYTFEMPSNRIAILQVNKAISEEAKETLYKHSTFVFDINGSEQSFKLKFDHLKALDSMQRIGISLDLKQAGQIPGWNGLAAGVETIEAVTCLLYHFVEYPVNRDTCIINILYDSSVQFLINDFWHILACPVAFRTVEFRIEHPWTYQRKCCFGPSLGWSIEHSSLPNFHQLDQYLRPEFGPGECGYDGNSVFIMRYHPRTFIETNKPGGVRQAAKMAGDRIIEY